MATYKLTYFDGAGRAELIRWLLSYLGKNFEDNRVSPQEWQELKKKTLFGKLPVLEIDGVQMNQSEAIGRYLAKHGKLAGDDDWECYQIDSIVGSISDLMGAVGPAFRMPQSPERVEAMKKAKEEAFPYYFGIFEKNITNGYLANGKLSWADIFFASFVVNAQKGFGNDIIDGFPNLKALIATVCELDGIKQWVNK